MDKSDARRALWALGIAPNKGLIRSWLQAARAEELSEAEPPDAPCPPQRPSPTARPPAIAPPQAPTPAWLQQISAGARPASARSA